MLKCPFCHFHNEDGSMFCEQCKSDLGGVAPAPAMAEAIPLMGDPIPLAAEPVHGFAAAPLAAIPLEPLAAAIPPAAVAIQLEPPTAPPFKMESIKPAASVTPPPATPAAPPAPHGTVQGEILTSVPTSGQPAAAPPVPLPLDVLPVGAQPKLKVKRGQKIGVEYPIYEGNNFLGRADEKPVDIDLEDQEPTDRVWCSRQHAIIVFENNTLAIEDLNSSNGTYVNRTRVYPGQKRPLSVNDIIQIGNVQMQVIL